MRPNLLKLVLLFSLTGFYQPSLLAADRLTIEVRETAGIRRFGYPVEVELALPMAINSDTPFRLLGPSGPITAQFRPAFGEPTGRRWWLDFSLNLLPHESRAFSIEYGADVVLMNSRGGLGLRELEQEFQITSGNVLDWRIPKNLNGLVNSLTHTNVQQLDSSGLGLFLMLADGSRKSVAELTTSVQRTPWTVKRSGPLAIRLDRHDELRVDGLRSITSDLRLQFVNTKSWVLVDWRLTNVASNVRGLGCELKMKLGQQQPASSISNRTIVDFGGTSWTYAQVAIGQEAALLGFPSRGEPNSPQRNWEVRHGKIGSAEPYVVGPGHQSPQLPEGWAHVMDSQMCLALAVDKFAQEHLDALTVRGDGTTLISRSFATEPSPAAIDLRFWLHFVTNPPHISAATSPQAMLAPLVVSIKSP